MRVQFCFQFIFPPFSFPGLLSREDPNSRGSPLALPPSLLPRLVLLFPFSLTLLLRVSLRFFRSEPSSPPLTSVYEARLPPTSLLYPHLPPLPPRTFTTPPPSTPSYSLAAVHSFRPKHPASLSPIAVHLFLRFSLSLSFLSLSRSLYPCSSFLFSFIRLPPPRSLPLFGRCNY